MLRYKGSVDLFMLTVVSISLIAAFFVLTEVNKIVGIAKIRGEVNVYIDLEDRGTKMLSFLSARKGDMNYMGILGCYGADNFPKEFENDLQDTLKALKQYQIIVQDSKKIIKEFKSIAPPKGGATIKGQIKLIWPVEAKDYGKIITSGYGVRMLSGKKDFHGGMDFAVLKGSEVYAVFPGKVVRMGKGCTPSPDVCKTWRGKNEKCSESKNPDPYCCCKSGLGNHVVLEHDPLVGENFYTHYDHMDEVYMTMDKQVGVGERMGTVGGTGYVSGVTGVHLHFEMNKQMLKKDETSINPCPYFPDPVPVNCVQESHRAESISVNIPMPNAEGGKVGLLL